MGPDNPGSGTHAPLATWGRALRAEAAGRRAVPDGGEDLDPSQDVNVPRDSTRRSVSVTGRGHPHEGTGPEGPVRSRACELREALSSPPHARNLLPRVGEDRVASPRRVRRTGWH